jgi:hypothetical protein
VGVRSLGLELPSIAALRGVLEKAFCDSTRGEARTSSPVRGIIVGYDPVDAIGTLRLADGRMVSFGKQRPTEGLPVSVGPCRSLALQGDPARHRNAERQNANGAELVAPGPQLLVPRA